jgi:3-phenylpropionate/trans-cinnamate dioxygenase ferredoxin subunit
MFVPGPVKIIDSNGKEITVDSPVFSLCRCGGSVTKTFCDGTHSKIEFEGAKAPVIAAEENRNRAEPHLFSTFYSQQRRRENGEDVGYRALAAIATLLRDPVYLVNFHFLCALCFSVVNSN